MYFNDLPKGLGVRYQSPPAQSKRFALFFGALALALSMLLILSLNPFRAFAVEGQEMQAGGSAGDKFTITSVQLIDPDDGSEVSAIAYYDSEHATQSVNLVYNFDTDQVDLVGGQNLELKLPDGFSLNTVNEPRPFIVNGAQQGSYTLDGERGVVIIQFNQQVNNLKNGVFKVDVSTDNNFLRDKVGTSIPVGGKQINVVKGEVDNSAGLVNKSGESAATGGEDLAPNQIQWSVIINQQKLNNLTEPLHIEDYASGIAGSATISQDAFTGAAPNGFLTIADFNDGAPQAVEGLKAAINERGNGFDITLTPEQINGKSLVLIYVVDYKSTDTTALLKVPNTIIAHANGDFPNEVRVSERIDTTSGSGDSDALGSFAENHYFFENEEKAALGKEQAEAKVEQDEPSYAPATIEIYSKAYSADSLTQKGYRLLKMEAGSPDTNDLDPNASSYENQYEAGKHKVVNYYYVRIAETPNPPAEDPKGSFKEVHIYYDSTEDMTNDKQASKDEPSPQEGTEKESYTHQKKEKDSYKLVSVVSDSDPKANFNENGDPATGNFVANKELTVTYKYVKETTEPAPPAEDPKGSFQATHIYYNSQEDLEANKPADTVVDERQEGTEQEDYTHQKKEKADYKFVSVVSESDPQAIIDKDGNQASGKFVAEKHLTATYKYVKEPDDPIVVPVDPETPKKGSFIETHLYYESEAKLASDEPEDTVKGDKQEGTADQSYTTQKKDKEGYRLVRVSSESDPEARFNSDGSAASGNFVPEKELNVVYRYVKETPEPTVPNPPAEDPKGSFKEVHIYYDSTEDMTNDKQASKDEPSPQEGTEKESYTHQKKEKDSYKLVSVVSDSDPKANFNENGDPATGNFVANKELTVTYKYVKETTEPTEPTEPQPTEPTKPKDPEKPETPNPVEPKEPAKPVVPSKPEPGTPAVPTKPEPSTPARDTAPKKEQLKLEKALPKTADSSNGLLAASIALASLLSLGAGLRFRKN